MAAGFSSFVSLPLPSASSCSLLDDDFEGGATVRLVDLALGLGLGLSGLGAFLATETGGRLVSDFFFCLGFSDLCCKEKIDFKK